MNADVITYVGLGLMFATGLLLCVALLSAQRSAERMSSAMLRVQLDLDDARRAAASWEYRYHMAESRHPVATMSEFRPPRRVSDTATHAALQEFARPRAAAPDDTVPMRRIPGGELDGT
jgi:hypothetical protein